ncbi:MAG: zinc ribbon domain-containing protein, partial [Candidatus Thorarchaeota archaeon]
LLITVIAVLTGLLGCIMAVHSSQFIAKMPQRAATDLKMAGILIIIVGFITLFNIFSITSGVMILIAGTECNAVWKRIQQARQKTGWPFTTVATAAGSLWARRLSCRFCGAPLVVHRAMSTGHMVNVEAFCPLDKTTEAINLPLSQLESWVSEITDRLHRCERCGDRTAALIVISQNSRISRLRAYCPQGHSNQKHRLVWTPLYPHVTQTPAIDVGFKSARVHPRIYPSVQARQIQSTTVSDTGMIPLVIQPAPSITKPIPLSSRSSPSRRVGPIKYCSNCGVNIEEVDKFCYRCGSRIQ